MALKWYRLSGLVMTLLAGTATVNTPVSADDGTAPLHLTASLASPAAISLGEPILIHYDLSNDATRKVGLKRGGSGTTWYDVVVADDQGNKAPTIPDLRPAQPAGAHPTMNVFLNSGSHSEGYIVATQHVKIQHPGRYTLFFRVHLSYATVENSNQEPQETPEALAEKSGLVMTQEVTFPITVTREDSNRLHYTAERLRQQIERKQDVPLARAELDALFSMPAPQVAASWRNMALRKNMSPGGIAEDSDAIADELAQLHSDAGVDILVQMLNTPGIGDTHISNCLNNLYNNSDIKLRSHIRDAAAALGIEMPSKVNTPIVIG